MTDPRVSIPWPTNEELTVLWAAGFHWDSERLLCRDGPDGAWYTLEQALVLAAQDLTEG